MFRRDLFRSGRLSSGKDTFRILAGPTVTAIGENGAVVTWQMNAVCSGQVEYGLTAGYGSTTTEAPISSGYSQHSQAISGLAAGTTYHYRTKSTDAEATTVYSDDLTFTTDETVSLPGTEYAAPSPTGGNDGPMLAAWFAGLPDGTSGSPTVAVFDPADTYIIGDGSRVDLWDARHLWIYGMARASATGDIDESTPRCTINNIGNGDSSSDSAFGIRGASTLGVKVIGFNIVGGNAANYLTAQQHQPAYQQAIGIHFPYTAAGGDDVELAYNIIEYQFGHAIYLRSVNGGGPGTQWTNVNIHHNVIRGMGTMGLNVANCDGPVYIDDNKFYNTGMYPIDVEDAASPDTCENLYIRRNLFDTWTVYPAYNGPKCINMNADMVHSYIYIQNNTFTGTYTLNGAPGDVGSDHTRGMCHMNKDWTGGRWDHVYFHDNYSDVPHDGVQFSIRNVDTLECTGNQMTGSTTALDGGADNADIMLSSSGSTGVTETGNTWL